MPYLTVSDDAESEENLYRFDPATLLHLDTDAARRLQEQITDFYRNQLQVAGMDGYVVGLSGGIDSTTTAHLLVDAVGADRVTGVLLPPPHAEAADQDAVHVANELGITTNDYTAFRTEIPGVIDTLDGLGQEHDSDDVQRVKRGNILARCRMIVIRDIARANDCLVAGTTNASERQLGYMTLAADGKGGVDNEALYDLYKTTVRDLAAHIGVPEDIIEKTPSADLWPGQTDTDELGFDYTVIDRVLAGIQLDMAADTIVTAVPPVNADDVAALRERMEQNRYKQAPAPYPEF
jgi:NAD+ synthase